MGRDYWNHIEPFWDSINIYDGAEEFLQGFMETPEHAAHLFALHWCASEVCNGGFHQFFFNSTGVLAPEAVAGFKAIGMPQIANVIAEAMASFGEPFPRDREERQDALDALTVQSGAGGQWQSPFQDIDARFYDLLGHENGGMEKAAEEYAARFPVPDGPLHGAPLLSRLLAALR